MSRMPVVAPLVTAIMLLGTSASYAQLIPLPELNPSPSLIDGVLTIGNTTLQPDDAATQEELPGLGHKFELLGVMVKDTDPENNAGNPGGSGGGVGGNEVISATTTPTTVALAYRKLGSGIRIEALTNQMNLKYFFEGRSCGGGSPRLTLLIDTDGDGDTDFAGHGHVNPPLYAGCVTGQWKIEDLTDNLPRWEPTPGNAIPGFPFWPPSPWKTFRDAVAAAFPAHQITAGFLVDDSCSFFAASCGKAYYDLLTIENRTLEIWQDAVKK